MVIDGLHVVSRGWYPGVYRTTGKAFRAWFSHWYEVRSGQIIRFEQVVDSAEVLPALQ